MSQIRVIYHGQQPNFPATDQHPDAVRFTIQHPTRGTLFVDAIGSYTPAQQAQDLVSIWTAVNDVLNGASYVNGAVQSSATLNELGRVDQG